MPLILVRVSGATAALVFLFAGLPTASADYLDLKLNSSGSTVTYNPYGGQSVTVGGGAFHWTQSTPINANYSGSLSTYCIDLDHEINTGKTYQYSVQGNLALAPTIGNDVAKINAITQLFDEYYNKSLQNATNAAAFQLALWKLVYDGATHPSLTNGRVEGSNSLAQSMLDSLGKPYSNHDLNGYQLVTFLSTDGHQDQIGVVPAGTVPSSVPAPPGLMLAGIGALALFGRTRWNRRTPSGE